MGNSVIPAIFNPAKALESSVFSLLDSFRNNDSITLVGVLYAAKTNFFATLAAILTSFSCFSILFAILFAK